MQNRSNDSTHTNTVLVLGGSGKTGRRVVERLAARGTPLRVGSRVGAPPFDWDDQTTWAAALRNIASVYLVYAPDVAVPGASAKISAFMDSAVRSGVQRLVLLSGRGEEEAQRCEQVVQHAGVAWTILRSSWFSQNFSETFLCGMVRGGTIALPAGHVAEPFVDVEDIADVAVAALTEDGHAGQLYELSGPRLLTFAHAAEEIAAVTGRDVRFVPVSAVQFAAMLADADVPAEMAALLTYLFTTVLDGRNAHVTDGIQRVLGRQGRDFAAYVQATAALGVWSS